MKNVHFSGEESDQEIKNLTQVHTVNQKDKTSIHRI